MIATEVRRGWRHWRSAYVAMMRFDVVRNRTLLVAVLVAQLLMGVGAGIMYGFYLGSVDDMTALYLASGVPALSIIPVGFLMVPLLVMQDRFSGTFEFTWSLPVPRLAAVASTFTIFTVISLPVSVLATGLAAWRFGVGLAVSPLVVPAAILVALMATSVGYGMSLAIPNPRLTNLITNILVFVVLLFSPIAVPIERFPAWLASVHEVLPFYHMANLLRATVTEGLVTDAARSAVTVTLWAIGGWAAALWVVGRRR